jgi:protein TonB
MPASPAILIDEPAETGNADSGAYVQGGIPGTGSGGGSDFMRSLLNSVRPAEAPPVPVARPVEPPKAPTAPITVSKGVQEAMLIDKVIPRYPPLALKARIQGIVHLTALISREGRVTQLQVISGHPMLIPPAIEAVKQWRYRPTLLSGVPMEVVTQVDVKFMLGQ